MDEQKIPFWRDDRVLKIVGQVIVLAVILVIGAIIVNNVSVNLRRLGLPPGFGFLNSPAGFSIGDTAIPYSSTDTFGRALLVGIVNTLRVALLGIVLATLLGIVVGIARLSNNWLVRQLALVYVEIFRNTPLLLQLFLIYQAGFLKLPSIENPLRLPAATYLSNKGMHILWPASSLRTTIALILIVASIILGLILWQRRLKVMELQGGSVGRNYQIAVIALAVIGVLALLFGLEWEAPQFTGNSVDGGLYLSSEFGALLFGLVFYTAAFIAEVVRAGIQSVSKGQWEASQALGLQSGLTMRLVVFPQALRVMIPPLTSEYLNLAKNSSLAAGIAFPDFFQVAFTINNQTGRVLQVLLLIMIVYLTINLIISLIMNGLNQRVQIKER
ncbi:MAG: ABC transporter permease subunit [Synechococcales cyanobacterium C42_A2020_086]|jgi:general L-amino acid transport system permease protein|nr:ABC transporter permease subunit [Synechococcales cyanobacterium C42_A2020_086]